jgi:glycosyltransferase involved in cell wall biosynthesis
MNIAIIEPVGAHGGNDTYDFNLIKALMLQTNTTATFYTCDITKLQESINMKLLYKNIFGNSNKFFRAFRYVRGTFMALINARKDKVDIIHLHFFQFNSLEYINLYLAKKVFGFTIVATIHDVESFEKYARNDTSEHNYEKFIRLIDGIVVHTDYAKAELINNIGTKLISPSKIKTIYACDLDYSTLENNQIEMNIAREKLNLPQDKKILLFFGQIKKVKGLDVLLKSLVEVRKEIPEILLVVAGKVWKDDFSEYEKLIIKYSLQNNVDLRIDFVANDDVPYYFNAVDAIVLPYQKIYNSGVLIRAMSFATPVIASNFGPFKEFLINGENGFLFKTGDAKDLANTIVNTLASNVSFRNIGQEGKRTIEKEFSLYEIGIQYREFYTEILGEK